MLIGLHKRKKPKDAEKVYRCGEKVYICGEKVYRCGKRPAYADKTTDA